MNFGISKNKSYTVIKVFNDTLDALMAPGLKSELVAIVNKGEKNILVDLSFCNLCDSSGMSALLLGNRLCLSEKGRLVIYGVKPEISAMFELAGFDALLNFAESREAAEELLIE